MCTVYKKRFYFPEVASSMQDFFFKTKTKTFISRPRQRPFFMSSRRLETKTKVSRLLLCFFHLPRSIASFLFKLRAWQSFCTTSLHVLFGLPLGLEPSTSYSIHLFTQSVSSFHSTCLYHHNLFCCSINIISSIPDLPAINIDEIPQLCPLYVAIN